MTTLIATYPALTALADTLRGLPVHEVPAGTTLFREHEACAGFPLLLQGEVRVSRNTSQGRTLELYRVVPGELCLVSSSALFAQTALSAQGVTTRDTQLALLPPAAFRHALADTLFGGLGNDIGLDNISFFPCGPVIKMPDTSYICVSDVFKLTPTIEINDTKSLAR